MNEKRQNKFKLKLPTFFRLFEDNYDNAGKTSENYQKILSYHLLQQWISIYLCLFLLDLPVISWHQAGTVQTQQVGPLVPWRDWQLWKTPHLRSSRCCLGRLDSPSPPAAPSVVFWRSRTRGKFNTLVRLHITVTTSWAVVVLQFSGMSCVWFRFKN